MKTITVFTPTYNRAYTLSKCYKSLLRQTSKDFDWLIIDDGSTDNTKELVDSWKKKDNGFNIIYIYQHNQGMHGAHNTAYENINTELNVCIDSDDYLTDNAIEIIINHWRKEKKDNLAGIVALDAYENRQIIGNRFPSHIKEATYHEIYHKLGIYGDKKFIYRTDLMKNNPYPIFENEKYVSLAYKYAKLENYQLSLLNETICIVEYMEDGSTKNMFKQYKMNPKGFSFIRLENMNNPKYSSFKKFKESIHYISSSMMSKNIKFLSKSPCKLITILAIPFGLLLFIFIQLKTSIKIK